MNIKRYSLHKQKIFEILNKFSEHFLEHEGATGPESIAFICFSVLQEKSGKRFFFFLSAENQEASLPSIM